MVGAVRLAILPSSDRERLGSPTVKRAEQILRSRNRGAHALSEWIARLSLAWACIPYPAAGWVADKAVPFPMIPAVRVWEACSLIQAGPAGAELLAGPSAADGSVRPEALLARLATWRNAPILQYDMEVALLRLSPVDASFWESWDTVHPASAAQARQAYRAGMARLALHPVIKTAPDRQGRIRTTVHVDITSDPPASGRGSRCWQRLTDPPDPVLYFDFNSYMSPVVASWPLLCPRQPELAAAHLLGPLSDCLVPGKSHAVAGATAVTGLARSARSAISPCSPASARPRRASASPPPRSGRRRRLAVGWIPASPRTHSSRASPTRRSN